MPDELPTPPMDRQSEDDAGQEVSLARLSQAFADALGRSQPAEQRGRPAEPAPQEDEFPPLETAGETDVDPVGVLEAMLFVGAPDNRPLTAAAAAAPMRGVEPEEIHDLVAELNRRYEHRGCPYEIRSEGAGYRMVLREEFRRVRDRFHGRTRQARLSQAAIDVLALVAYHQPVTRDKVNDLRGAASNAILSQLVRRGLLRIERDEEKPRTVRYRTTGRFLSLLGLETLRDLPQPEDVERR